MSLALLKQSMGILEEDLPKPLEKKSKALEATKKTSNFKQKNKQTSNSSTFVGQPQKQKANLQDIRRELKLGSSKSDANLKRLLALSQNTVNVADANKIVKRAHKGRYVEKVLPKVEQESIFTEADFAAFEAEYFA